MHTSAALQPGRIVLVALDTLGDHVLRQPLLSALAEQGRVVAVVVRHGYEEVLPFLDPRVDVITTPITPYRVPGVGTGAALDALAAAISRTYPTTIVAAAFSRTWADEWMLHRFASCESVGFLDPSRTASLLDSLPPHLVPDVPRRAVLFDRTATVPAEAHEAAKARALFEAITGASLGERPPVISIDDAVRKAGEAEVRSLGFEPGRFAFACPAGTVTVGFKAWPVDQFVAVAQHLDRRHDLPVLLTGVADEAEMLHAAQEACTSAGVRARVWIGPPGSFGRMLGLIAASRLYIGNDTGPMHCAAALDVPVVARFGGGHWPRFLPVASRSFTATQQLPCFGCGWQCWLSTPACMTAIDTSTFTKGIDWLLSGVDREQRVDTGSVLDAEVGRVLAAAKQTTDQLRSLQRPGDVPSTRHRPKVFIVSPSFNQGRYLRETIESVLAQDYAPLEYFVADGGSTDGSVEILKSYGDRIRWTSGPDGGQAAAIADAWAKSDADVVAWLNSDDTYLEGAVSAAVAYLEANPESSMVYGQAWYTDAAGRRTRPYRTQPFDRQALAGDCFICQPTVFIRRNVFQVVALPDRQLRFVMDYDLWIRISQYFHVGYFDRFLATSRLHAENKTLSQSGDLIREAAMVSKRHFGSAHPRWVVDEVQDRVARATARLRVLPPPLRGWITERVTTTLARLAEAPPFEDGWAGPRVLLPVELDETRWVTIEAEFPQWPFAGPVRVIASHEGHVLDTCEIRGPGAFTLAFLVPGVSARPSVRLETNRAFAAKQHGLTADPRVLSFRIQRVGSEPPVSAIDRERSTLIARRSWSVRLLPVPVQAWVLAQFAGEKGVVESAPFEDGWMGPRTRMAVVPNAQGYAVVEGVCGAWPYAFPLRVSVHHEGTVVASTQVVAGQSFSLGFQIPKHEGGPAQVLLLANRSFVPREHGVSADSRRLSFMIVRREPPPEPEGTAQPDLTAPSALLG